MMNNDFEAELRHRFRFQSHPLPGLAVTIYCEVLEVEAPKRLIYSWKEHHSDEASRVIWTLSPVEGGTQVRLQHRAIGSMPIPVFGISVPNRSNYRALDAQFASAIALVHPLKLLSSNSKDVLSIPSEFSNRQTNWHYWLKQKLPEVLDQSSL
jgi:Activator of Hsp90 ATPase homolog 1-like protein